MDEAAALEEARRRWPAMGAWVRQTWHPQAPFSVGVTIADQRGTTRKRMGHGLTWERAFLSADRRAQCVPRGRRTTRTREMRATLEQLVMFEGQGRPHALDRG